MEPRFEVVPINGKGLGLVAKQDFKRGNVVLSEVPLLKCQIYPLEMEGVHSMPRALAAFYNKEIAQKVAGIPKEDQKKFLSLHSVCPGKYPFLGVAISNGFPVNSEYVAVYNNISRINHACAPNADYAYNSKTGRGYIRAVALDGIKKGEEVTIDYSFGIWEPYHRRPKLMDIYQFNCLCAGTCDTVQSRNVSDNGFEMLFQTRKLFIDSDFSRFPELLLQRTGARIYVLQRLRIENHRVAEALREAWWICVSQGDMNRARIFGNRALSAYRECYGDDQPFVKHLKEELKNPSSLPFHNIGDWHGLSKIGDAIKEEHLRMPKEEYEYWLWHPGILSRMTNGRTGFASTMVYNSLYGSAFKKALKKSLQRICRARFVGDGFKNITKQDVDNFIQVVYAETFGKKFPNQGVDSQAETGVSQPGGAASQDGVGTSQDGIAASQPDTTAAAPRTGVDTQPEADASQDKADVSQHESAVLQDRVNTSERGLGISLSGAVDASQPEGAVSQVGVDTSQDGAGVSQRGGGATSQDGVGASQSATVDASEPGPAAAASRDRVGASQDKADASEPGTAATASNDQVDNNNPPGEASSSMRQEIPDSEEEDDEEEEYEPPDAIHVTVEVRVTMADSEDEDDVYNTLVSGRPVYVCYPDAMNLDTGSESGSSSDSDSDYEY